MKKILFLLVGFVYCSASFAKDGLTFITEKIKLSNSNPKYEVQIEYPQIKTPTDESEKKFNAISKKWALETQSAFQTRDWQTEKNLPADLKANGSSLTVKYDLATLEPKKIISLRFLTDTYIAGSAHPSHTYASINYDLDRSQLLTLKDLFDPKTQYLEYIAKFSGQKIKAKLDAVSKGQVELFKEGLTPTAQNYATWNLVPEGIRFTFNEYQVAPYVFGPQEVVISFNDLDKFVPDRSPLAKCIEARCIVTLHKQPEPK